MSRACSTLCTKPPAGFLIASPPSRASSPRTTRTGARFIQCRSPIMILTGGTDMTASRTKFYLDKQNANWMGVCEGIADYTGIDVLWVRIGAVLIPLMGAFPWTVIAYFLVAWLA